MKESKKSIPKPFIFVLMPFQKEFDDIYEFGIKSACYENGFYCERVDEQDFEGSILDRIYNQISKADLIIADMSNQNPNVFYETGYAHALGKRVILLTQKSANIPFDMQHYSHIVYERQIKNLKNKLSAKLKWFIKNPKIAKESLILGTEYYYEGNNVDNLIILSKHYGHVHGVVLKIAILNRGDKTIPKDKLQIAINTSQVFNENNNINKWVLLPDNSVNHYVSDLEPIFPNAWFFFSIILTIKDEFQSKMKTDNIENMKVLEFSEYGRREIPFKVKFVEQELEL